MMWFISLYTSCAREHGAERRALPLSHCVSLTFAVSFAAKVLPVGNYTLRVRGRGETRWEEEKKKKCRGLHRVLFVRPSENKSWNSMAMAANVPWLGWCHSADRNTHIGERFVFRAPGTKEGAWCFSFSSKKTTQKTHGQPDLSFYEHERVSAVAFCICWETCCDLFKENREAE